MVIQRWSCLASLPRVTWRQMAPLISFQAELTDAPEFTVKRVPHALFKSVVSELCVILNAYGPIRQHTMTWRTPDSFSL